jgi:hypothetical protein
MQGFSIAFCPYIRCCRLSSYGGQTPQIWLMDETAQGGRCFLLLAFSIKFWPPMTKPTTWHLSRTWVLAIWIIVFRLCSCFSQAVSAEITGRGAGITGQQLWVPALCTAMYWPLASP